MEKIEIAQNIYICRFEKTSLDSMGLNIVLIENGDKTLLIDTGFEDNFLELKSDLDKRDMIITDVVVSHFHPDHIGGLRHLRNTRIYGSDVAEITLRKFGDDIDQFLPNKEVSDELLVKFGNHELKLKKNPGHSIDGMLVTIDNRFVYVGDEMIFSHNGNALYPFCADRVFENHIMSIKNILHNYQGKIIIPAHGEMIENQDKINKDLENRLTYLEHIEKNPKSTSRDFIRETGIMFIGMKNHIYNTKKR